MKMMHFDIDQACAELRDNGIVVLRDVLDSDRVGVLNALIDGILESESQRTTNMFQAAFNYAEILSLVEEGRILSLIVDLLGYNLQLQSSVLSVKPPVPAREEGGMHYGGKKLPPSGAVAESLNWHRDGPSPRFPHIETFSAKVAFVLSDLTEPDRGNTKVIPGSHLHPDLRPDHADSNSPVEGEMQILAAPGDAYIFSQNMWHAAAVNRSSIERRLIIIGYGACWTRPLDYDTVPAHLLEGASPILRQLLGEVGPTPMHHYIPDFMPLEKYWRGGEVVHSYA
jgi:ectoine hydroxylase-related dioxygenase (phytanoyl-CoA dioxygenase family)